jgi:hypothetical protein
MVCQAISEDMRRNYDNRLTTSPQGVSKSLQKNTLLDLLKWRFNVWLSTTRIPIGP